MSECKPTEPLYIFGYGSLLFKQNFPFTRMIPCRIKGYKRVFYQGSTDHRGVPGKPGRVVTLLPLSEGDSEDYCVYGAAFEIPPEEVPKALKILDFREKGGYTRVEVCCYAIDGDEHLVEGCMCYIADEDNEEYLGPSSEEHIAKHMLECEGPSGPNIEYLYKLAGWLREMKVEDPHVFEIERCAKRISSS